MINYFRFVLMGIAVGLIITFPDDPGFIDWVAPVLLIVVIGLSYILSPKKGFNGDRC